MKAVGWRGVVAELTKTLPLELGETVLAEGAVRLCGNALIRRLCYIRLSNRRLCLVEHLRPTPINHRDFATRDDP